MCNTATAIIFYSILQIVFTGFALQKDWLTYQPACFLRAYLYAVACTVVPFSFVVQTVSRLFFSVLYNYRQLLTWRVHWYMIIMNYVIAILEGFIPFSFSNAYQFEIESRLCMVTTKTFSSSMISIFTAYAIPTSIIVIVDIIIIRHVRQSTRRVVAFREVDQSEITTRNLPRFNAKREIQLMTNVMILVCIPMFGGIPYIIMVIWHATQTIKPPEPMYLLTMAAITIVFIIEMMALLYLNKDMNIFLKNSAQKLKRLW